MSSIRPDNIITSKNINFQSSPNHLTIVVGADATNLWAYTYDGLAYYTCGGLPGAGVTMASVGWDGTQWVSVGNKSTPANSISALYYSRDGQNWVAPTDTVINAPSTTGQYQGIAWNGQYWLTGAQMSNGNAIYYSTDALSWTKSTVSAFTTQPQCFVWCRNFWIAGGIGAHSLAYSFDGQSFIGYGANSPFGTGGFVLTLCWTGSLLVIGGSASATLNGMYYAAVNANTDPTALVSGNWTAISTIWNAEASAAGSCYTIEWNGKIFVAGGAAGTNNLETMGYSYDGKTWVALGASSPFGITSGAACNSVAWDGNRWIASGRNSTGTAGLIYTSLNGINWNSTGITVNGTSTNTLFSLSSGGVCSSFVSKDPFINEGIISNNGTSSISFNNSNGNTIELNAAGNNAMTIGEKGFKKIQVDEQYGTFLKSPLTLVGGDTSGTTQLQYSFDGVTFVTTASTTLTTIRGIAHNNSRYVIVGSGSNTIAHGINGLSYTGLGSGTNIFSTQGNGVAWNGTYFVAVGEGTHMFCYSTDGITWIGGGSASNTFTTRGTCVCWNGDLWVLGGEGTNTFTTTRDLVTFTAQASSASNFTTKANGIAWNGELFVAVGSGTNSIAYSTTGLTWTVIASGAGNFSTAGFGVCWGVVSQTVAGNNPRGRWVAVGQGTNAILYSYNGSNWVIASVLTVFSTQGYSVTFNGKYFVATGTGTNQVAYSLDGISWTGVVITNMTNGYSSYGGAYKWSGSSTLPSIDYRTLGYSNVGIYSGSKNTLDIESANVNHLSIGNNTVQANKRIRIPYQNGGEQIGFGRQSTGGQAYASSIFVDSSNVLNIQNTGGNGKLTFNSGGSGGVIIQGSGATQNSTVWLTINGSDDTNYRTALNVKSYTLSAGVSTAGVLTMAEANDATQPSYSFIGDPNTGMYRVGADNLGFSTGGTLRFDISTTLLTSTLPYVAPVGSITAPAFYFTGDPNTGLYWVGADTIGFTTNSTLKFSISDTIITSILPISITNSSAISGASINGYYYYVPGGNIANNTASNTINFNYFGVPNLTNLTATTTTTLHIAGAPTGTVTSATSYALYVAAGKSYFGDSILMNSTNTATIALATQSAARTYTIPDSGADANFVMSSASGNQVTTGTITVNNATASTSNATGAILTTGGIGISNVTDASSATNGGTFTTAGGLAVAKSIWGGTNLTLSGTSSVLSLTGTSSSLVISGTTIPTTSGTGALIVTGGIGLGNLSTTASRISFGSSYTFTGSLGNKLIALHDTNNNQFQFYGLGVNGAILRYTVDATTADHGFYAATSSSTANELFRIKGTGVVQAQDGVVGAPSYSFVSEPTTGMYYPSAGNLALTVLGTQCLNINANTLNTTILTLGRETDNAPTAAAGDGNYLLFAGTNSDASDWHTIVAERIWQTTESSELYLFKGNDASDRIRLRSSSILFQTYTGTEVPSSTTSITDNNTRLTIGTTLTTSTLPISITDATASTSSSTGSLYTTGGLGVEKNMWLGGTAFSGTNASVVGSIFNIPAFTYTCSTSTPANVNIATITQVTISNATAITNAASLYIANAPAVTGGGSITNAYALQIAAGATLLGGQTILGASLRRAFLASASTSLTLDLTHSLIELSSTSAVAITLPTGATYQGVEYTIIKTGASGTITITRGGSDFIDDGATTSITLTVQYDKVTLYYNGSSRWYII